MTKLLTRILAIHNDPKLMITKPMSDKECNPILLAECIEEDKTGWWIKHGSDYIMYCNKEGGPEGLEVTVNEVWGRFTKKNIAVEYNYSASRFTV